MKALMILSLTLIQLLLFVLTACGASAGQSVELVSPPEKEGAPGDFVTHVFKVANNTDTDQKSRTSYLQKCPGVRDRVKSQLDAAMRVKPRSKSSAKLDIKVRSAIFAFRAQAPRGIGGALQRELIPRGN